MTDKIKSRESYLVVQDLENELLIYDLKINKAFCLTESAAMIWRLCDGEKTVAEISRILSIKFQTPVSEDFVWLAIEELKNANLLADQQDFKSKFDGHSRREIILKAGLTTMIAFPGILSVVAPTAANAQSNSCTPSGQKFCIASQPDVATCLSVIPDAAVSLCCSRRVSDILFNRFDPTECCAICNTAP